MEPLNLNVGVMVSVWTPSGKRLNGVVAELSEDKRSVAVAVLRKDDSLGVAPLSWVDDHYQDPSGRHVRLAISTYINTTLKRLTTADGIMSVQQWAEVGQVYQMQVDSMEEAEWGHVDHPGKKWTRMSANFINPEGVGGMLPVELFDIGEKN
jgi:hypothetical protein